MGLAVKRGGKRRLLVAVVLGVVARVSDCSGNHTHFTKRTGRSKMTYASPKLSPRANHRRGAARH
jgi:hypothetical protein